jgi:hypothetical protein
MCKTLHMYVNTKILSVETIPGFGREKFKG